MKGYIYKIINSVNQKVYIGQTTRSIAKRWSEHKSEKGNCILLKRAIKKYGIESFLMEIVAETEASSKVALFSLLNELEIKFIKENNSLAPNGYNMRFGGRNASPTNLGKPGSWMGRKHTEASKEKIAASKRGKPRPDMLKHMDKIHEKCKKKIKCNETGQVWESVKDCAESFGVKPKQICRVLKGQRKRLKWQFTFSYLPQS
jgi:group I intron endonuclease